jgi:phospholipid transport system substrate-binding protein
MIELANPYALSRRVFVAVLAACAIFMASPSRAADESALVFAQKVGDSAITDLTAPGITDSARVKRMRQLLVNIFDAEAVGRFVLGPYTRQASPEEFKEFLKLYEVYVAHNYAGLFKRYNGQKVEYTREQPTPNGNIVVNGIIRQVSGPDIGTELRLHKVGDTYKAIDLRIEGVSMPLTHRKQFASVIAQRGGKVSGLISALKGAIAKFEKETPSE